MDLVEPSWISTEPPNHKVFDTLRTFLDTVSTHITDVDHLADSVAATLLSLLTPNAPAKRSDEERRFFFGILFTIVKQIDAAAARLDHLISLLLALRKLEGLDKEEIMRPGLGHIRSVWRDLEEDAPLHPPIEERPNLRYPPPRPLSERPPWRRGCGQRLTPTEWANMNAFMARLHSAAPDLPHIDNRGLCAMIDALEEPLTPSQLDDVLPAAAYWIIYAGNELRTNNIPYANFTENGAASDRLPWGRGPLWKGQHTFNQARWEFWIGRFTGIAQRTDASDTVRQLALRAVSAASAHSARS